MKKRIKVKIQWWQGGGVRTKECLLSNGNTTIHFADIRELDLTKLKLEDFRRQSWIFFDDGMDHFMVRYSDMISMEVIDGS